MLCTHCSNPASPGHYCCSECEAKWQTSTKSEDKDRQPKHDALSPQARSSFAATSTPVPVPTHDHLTKDEQMLQAARVLAQQKEWKKVIAFYQEACRRLPERVDAHRELCGILLSQALAAWLPWEKQKLFREAHEVARHAINLGDSKGDAYFVLAEASTSLGGDKNGALRYFHRAMELYRCQLRAGEMVSAYYLAAALRLAQRFEAEGNYEQAVLYYQIMAGAVELERVGRLAPGSFTAGQIERAQAEVARVQAKQTQGGVR